MEHSSRLHFTWLAQMSFNRLGDGLAADIELQFRYQGGDGENDFSIIGRCHLHQRWLYLIFTGVKRLMRTSVKQKSCQFEPFVVDLLHRS